MKQAQIAANARKPYADKLVRAFEDLQSIVEWADPTVDLSDVERGYQHRLSLIRNAALAAIARINGYPQ